MLTDLEATSDLGFGWSSVAELQFKLCIFYFSCRAAQLGMLVPLNTQILIVEETL